jgi:NADH:ubiquinone oxidoreductase subunit 2 (subunit N)
MLLKYSELSQGAELPIWFPIGIAMVTIGMLFKIAAVPFHFWAPDVYEGSPALVHCNHEYFSKSGCYGYTFQIIICNECRCFEYKFQMVNCSNFYCFDDRWKHHGITSS